VRSWMGFGAVQFVAAWLVWTAGAEDGGWWVHGTGTPGSVRVDSLITARCIAFAFSRPVIIRGVTDNTRFRVLCSRSGLLQRYGSLTVRLSTANTHSYRKVDVAFQDYVDRLLRPQDAAALGSETLYFFGDNNLTEWQNLLDRYRAPPYFLPGRSAAYSFGIAGPGTGVPFHWHGPGFSEVIYGRKVLYFPDRWWHATLNLDTTVFISTFLG
uniref:Uncharacterized protein n=1 Tax=Xiphophorus couchianus TaxID=32473 RepID=A0A3B5M4Z4_9TELE